MKKTTKFIIISGIFTLALLIPNSAKANYQIVKGGYVDTIGNSFIGNVRNMEASGQVMGLNETKDGATLLSTSGSNNIDVHMVKNTEYGAMLLLSASPEYGKQGTGTARYVGNGTTTGNVYGVYKDNGTEYVAGQVGGESHSYMYTGAFPKINGKYINIYTNASDRKNGDALLNWHDSTNSGIANPYGIWRSTAFGFGAPTTNGSYGNHHASARAAVVCGQGF